MQQDIRKNDPFQPVKLSGGSFSRAGQFNVSSDIESEVLKEASVREESRSGGPNPRKKSIKFFLVVGASILIVGLLGSSFYFYYQYKALKGDNSKKEIALYVKQLDQLMVLPTGEDPTLATVTDKNKLSGQLFFANAENGDKVLVFSKAGKAVLYRPKDGKIVEMMMLSGNFSEASTEEKQIQK